MTTFESSNEFQSLPEDIIYNIFIYLSAKDLCHISCTCKRLYVLSCDNYLWKKKLQNDKFIWKSLGNVNNPEFYRQKSLSNKEIYLSCLPEYQNFLKNISNKDYTIHNMLNAFKSIFKSNIPKVALLGPGLESETSCFVTILMNESPMNPLKIVDIFPGSSSGYGSGFTFELKERKYSFSKRLNLSIIYSSTKKERNNLTTDYNRLSHNKLLTSESNDVPEHFDLTTQSKDFFQTMNGIIYAVDSNMTDKTLWSLCKTELHLLMKHMSNKPNVPILVLSLSVDDISFRKVSCVDIIELLELNKHSGKWQVMVSTVLNMSNVDKAFSWILSNCEI